MPTHERHRTREREKESEKTNNNSRKGGDGSGEAEESHAPGLLLFGLFAGTVPPASLAPRSPSLTVGVSALVRGGGG